MWDLRGLSVCPPLSCGGTVGGWVSLTLDWLCLCQRPQGTPLWKVRSNLLLRSCWKGERQAGVPSHRVLKGGRPRSEPEAWAAQELIARCLDHGDDRGGLW